MSLFSRRSEGVVPCRAVRPLPLGLLLSLVLSACQSKAPAPAAEQAEPQPPRTEQAAAPTAYGEPLTEQSLVSLAELLSQPETHAGKTVLVEGLVRRACSVKGCWLELATSSEAAAPGCRVTFKDYSFLVPTDSAGATARVQGRVEVTRVKPAHVEHLEGEGATFDKKDDDGTATELRVVATGVELRRG